MEVRNKIFDVNLKKNLMKSKDRKKLSILKVLQSEIQRKEDSSKKLKDNEILNILKKSKKSCEEVKAENWEEEVEFIGSFIPKLMPIEEVESILDKLLENNPNANIGFIMGYFNKEYSGLVDNKELSKLVREKIKK